jgi:GAF domain-containing protein
LNVRCADTGILEADRLAALDRYDILDTDREAAFDDIVELASVIFEAPIAVVNLVADGRQWFKAEIGIGARELPLDVSICSHAILQRGVFVVPDLAADPRFECNPLVKAAGGSASMPAPCWKRRKGCRSARCASSTSSRVRAV